MRSLLAVAKNCTPAAAAAMEEQGDAFLHGFQLGVMDAERKPWTIIVHGIRQESEHFRFGKK